MAVLVTVMIAFAATQTAWATIYEAPGTNISSSTNPGDISDYDVAWREGWGNDPLPKFFIPVPQPDAKLFEPAILGAFYAITRPESVFTTLTVADWPSSYNAILVGKTEWPLAIDVPGEVAYPGPLNVPGWTPPVDRVLSRTYEGPFTVKFQFYAPGVSTAWSSGFLMGLDMTPPLKVTNLTARNGFGGPLVSGVLTQSRVFLDWEDKRYDSLSGTGYFEVFLDGEPYPNAPGSTATRRVYDLQEHYDLSYGFDMATRRGLTIEDLPAGTHTLQVRAVDRATNEGPLSDSITVRVDPDIPQISITNPRVDGQPMGARPVFAADVTDRGGVDQVRFYVDGILRATQVADPFSAKVDLSAYGDGTSHTLRVEADDIGGRTNFAEKTFVIDKTPRVSILSPDAVGAVMSAPAQVSALIQDAAGIESVTFRVDGSVVETFAPASVDTTRLVAMAIAPVAAGSHTFEVTAVSTSGGSVVVSRVFTADPSVRISTLDFGPPSVLEGGLSGSSKTNPYVLNDPVTFWRELWGSSVFPQFTIVTPSFNPEQQVELLYAVDRNAMSQINPDFSSTYDRSSNWQGTEASLLIDQRGLVTARPSLSGLGLFPGRATDAVEGIWFWHVLFRDKDGSKVGPYDVQYGVDVTKPTKVTGVQIFPNKESATPASGWIDQSRGVLRWDNAQQDALSGTAYYRIYVDGTCVVPGEDSPGATLLDPESGDAGVPWYHEGRTEESLTLETFSPGAHTVEIAAVDRAGNEGTKSDPLTVRVVSTPAISIYSPASPGVTLTTPTPLRALVTDAAGLIDVVFSVDGVPVRTFTPATVGDRSMSPSMYQPLTGGSHTFLVTARSVSGTTQTMSRAFNVDATLPPVIPPPPGGGSGDTSVTVETEWFNNVFPVFKAYSGTRPMSPTELLYLVDRTPSMAIDPSDPNSYYGSFKPETGTTHFNGVIDQLGVYRSNPAAFDGALTLPGRVSSPLEGIWYIHALVRNADGEAGDQVDVAYGIDLTPPVKVDNVQVFSSNTAMSPSTGWLSQNRVVVRWDGSERDSLSGTDHYVLYIDGIPLSKWESGSEQIDYQLGRATMSLTLEDLPMGRHTIHVTAVDQAGNESSKSDPAVIGLDSDNPVVTILTPSKTGVKLGANSVLSARATDGGGIASVNFRVDGLSVGTVTPTSLTGNYVANLTPKWTEIPSGAHTLEVRATDLGGQLTVASRDFVLDRTAPTISSVSGAPSPFYPRKRDGYKDNFKVNFKTSEAGTARLVLKNSSGKVVRTVTKTVGSGSQYIYWTGKQSDNVVRSGTYKWTLSVTDGAGNKRTTSARTVKISFYQIVRLSSGSVRIISR
ncbi:MAG: hypothetical protein CVT67_00905 [Actinobacteria bacterium HGW-Actinobacteria-7]|nr:MAG: hypothetical protein CVT67_00905 [Actinobacteria bacterium HGW-Actinobacteria-7]